MAKYRGSKGSVSLGGSSIGNLVSWELNASRPVIDSTDMGDTASDADLDLPGGTGTITVRTDLGDTAQDAVADIVLTNTDSVTLAAIFTMDTGKTISVSIVPTALPVTAQIGQHVSSAISFVTSGGFTVAWA